MAARAEERRQQMLARQGDDMWNDCLWNEDSDDNDVMQFWRAHDQAEAEAEAAEATEAKVCAKSCST